MKTKAAKATDTSNSSSLDIVVEELSSSSAISTSTDLKAKKSSKTTTPPNSNTKFLLEAALGIDTGSVSSIGTSLELKGDQHWFTFESKHDVPLEHGVNPPPVVVPQRPQGLKYRAKKVLARGNPLTMDVPGNEENRPRVKGFGQGEQIKKLLAGISSDKEKNVLVVGLSPTGGGHTARCLNVVAEAVRSGKLKSGSTVVFQVPQKWVGSPRSPEFADLARKLIVNGINVINVGADKSVQGFLKPDGSSDDAQLVERFALMPLREKADIDSIEHAQLLTPPPEGKTLPVIDYNQDFPTITAKDLFRSLSKIVPDSVLRNQTRVLTDMAPDLHKAAASLVPDAQRVDQGNHHILLRLNPDFQGQNELAERAVLTKVLNPYGAKHSYIGLGDKNTLSEAAGVAVALNIHDLNSKDEARKKVAAHLLLCGLPANPDATDKQGKELRCGGIMKHDTVKNAQDVENVVFVYAHATQNRIARHIRGRLASPDAPEAFKKTLFLFAGKAVDGKKTTITNALHAAYLAQADGISTMGAGIAGELAYLHGTGGSKAGLAALPIKGHNEQEVNARVMEEQKLGKDLVQVLGDTSQDETLHAFVDKFVQERYDERESKYAGDMEKMLAALGREGTYVKHSHDLLFGTVELTKKEQSIKKAVDGMVNDPIMKANRRLNKLAMQVLARMQEKGKMPKHPAAAFSQKAHGKPEVVKFKSFRDFVNKLSDDRELQKLLNTTAPVGEVKTLKSIREYFQGVLDGTYQANDPAAANKLKEYIGSFTMTGF